MPNGNLAFIYQEILTSIVRLRSGRQRVEDANYFRGQFKEALRLAHEEARGRGYSDQQIGDARFAAVAFLDESILNLGNPIFDDWVRKPLQEEMFGHNIAGQLFFKRLDELMGEMDSPALADVLEIYLLCLLLGFAGKYSNSGKGELRGLRDTVLARLRRMRGYAADLSPAWRPPLEGGAAPGRDPMLRPLLVAAAACLLLLLAIFAIYKLSLNGGVKRLTEIAAVTPREAAPQAGAWPC